MLQQRRRCAGLFQQLCRCRLLSCGCQPRFLHDLCRLLLLLLLLLCR